VDSNSKFINIKQIKKTIKNALAEEGRREIRKSEIKIKKVSDEASKKLIYIYDYLNDRHIKIDKDIDILSSESNIFEGETDTREK
ncbi:hypothetical protein LOZ65_006893, partial [Ophidiomyces ophidiicola]